MVLSDKDSKLFYELWFPLLDFANAELGVNPEMGKIHGAKSLDPAEVKKIANALWDNIYLINEYLAKHGIIYILSILRKGVGSEGTKDHSVITAKEGGRWG